MAFRKKAIPGPVKVAVIRRAGAEPGKTVQAACVYCGALGSIWWPLTYTNKIGTHIGLRGLEFDHVHPELHGGESTAENLVLSCRPCNRRKGAKILENPKHQARVLAIG